jgi:hypothetical protein
MLGNCWIALQLVASLEELISMYYVYTLFVWWNIQASESETFFVTYELMN